MANVNSISNSNSYSSSTSLYGNRNVLTGLASGMDTEAMIQNSVAGYQTKITELQKEQTKIEWKQDAYRELIDQMASITSKYTSYSSKTNLSSNSFFTNAKTTNAVGENAAAVSVTGSTASDIQINSVTKLATAARYSVAASALDVNAASEAAGSAINWGQSVSKGTLSGTMTLKLGSSSIDIKFTDEDKYSSLDELVDGINAKLDAQSANVSASLGEDGTITFAATGDAKSKGDSVYIRSASGNLKSMLNVTTATSTADENRFSYTSFSVKGEPSGLTQTMTMAEYLKGKTVDVTLDGVTKSVTIGDLTGKTQPDLSAEQSAIDGVHAEIDAVKDDASLSDEERAAKNAELYDKLAAAQQAKSNKLNNAMSAYLAEDLQSSINKAFGANKVTVGVTENGGVRFDVSEKSGSQVKVSASVVGETLGLGSAGVSNYFNTGRKLGDLLGENWLNANARVEATLDSNAQTRYFDKDGNELKKDGDTYYRLNSDGSVKLKDGEKVEGTLANTLYSDVEGNLIKKYANEDTYYRVNEKGDWLYDLKINGATIGGFTKDTALESVMNKINSNTDAGVNVSYSNLTSQFVFTARETGASGNISFDNDLARKLFYADNSPASTSVEKLLGDFVTWDAEGKARLSVLSATGERQNLGEISKDITVDELIDKINNGSNSAFKDMIRYNEQTGTYEFTKTDGSLMTEEAANSFDLLDVKAHNSTSLNALFGKLQGGARTAGTDAVLDVTVNGVKRTLERSSNLVQMDGLSVTLKNTFNETESGEAISFSTSTKSDEVVDAIKSFVEDVNKLMSDVHSAYATQPLKKSSSGSTKRDGYDPLSDEDKADMSETAIKNYEEKAKTGLLFGDTDLSALYSRLLNVVQRSGDERVAMEAIGLTTTYSNGVTQIKLDEDKLRTALDNDVDKVREVFTKTKDSGAATDGLMASLKTTLNAYGSTSLGSQGLLVRKAGTKLSSVSLLNNTLQTQLNNLTKQIETWQTRLSDKVDYYTNQFTQLEKLMSTMNNQSSMLSDLMGY